MIFLFKLNDSEYSNMTGPNFWKKIGPSVGGQNDPFGVQKSTTWKKNPKMPFFFFNFSNDFSTKMLKKGYSVPQHLP